MTRRGSTNGLVFQLPQNGRRFAGTPYAHVMSFDVSVAVLGGWLPHWESPVGAQGFDVPYSERMKVVLTVEDDESLESVYRRAIEAIQPRAVPQADGMVPDPLDSVYWVWFYEPSDEANALHKYYETPRDLVGVGADGLARWNRDRGQIPYGDLIRSGNDGLLHGDPLRPYLVLQWPQGGGPLQMAWDALLLSWTVLGGIQTTVTTVHALRNIRWRLRGAQVIAEHREAIEERGGGPVEVRKLMYGTPWVLGDLRARMGVETDERARLVLELYGFKEDTDSRWRFDGENEEARFMRWAEEDVFALVGLGLDVGEHLLRERLETMLRTGEPPDLPEPPSTC
jgi:hypothetical protein